MQGAASIHACVFREQGLGAHCQVLGWAEASRCCGICYLWCSIRSRARGSPDWVSLGLAAPVVNYKLQSHCGAPVGLLVPQLCLFALTLFSQVTVVTL